MFPVRTIFLTGLVLCSISLTITQVDARASPQTILGSFLRTKGEIKNAVNQGLADTVDTIAGKGKEMLKNLKGKLNVFGQPSEEKPSDPSAAGPLSRISQWIRDRFSPANTTSLGNRNPIFGIIVFGRPEESDSTTASPTTSSTESTTTSTTASSTTSTTAPSTTLSTEPTSTAASSTTSSTEPTSTSTAASSTTSSTEPTSTSTAASSTTPSTEPTSTAASSTTTSTEPPTTPTTAST